MSNKAYTLVGIAVLLLVVISQALGFLQMLDPYVSADGRAMLGNLLLAVAIICLGKAAWSAWALERSANEALRIANESNVALQRRVEAAEAKLVKVLDEGIVDWAPAYERLIEQSDRRIRDQTEGGIDMMREAYNSFRRRAERGYLGGDDTQHEPPPITPTDI